jgi:hypothetical protein
MRILVPFFFLLSICACQAQPLVKEVRLGPKNVALLLDSSAAARHISQDRRDGFFEKVTASEMSIQMKQALQPGDTREKLLSAYLQFLRSDVADYSPEESKFTAEVIEKVFKTCESVATGLFPDTLLLIKTKGKHYGDGVWYTRENSIVIPANELVSRKTNPFTSTMFHEVFHVYSRLNPAKQQKLYQLIGFQGVGYKNLRLPPQLAERVLFNPDGVDFAQKISLAQPDGKTIQAVPIIFANHVGHKAGNNEFFGYVEFTLYQVEPNGDGSWRVVTKPDGHSSTLSLDSQPDFFAQIKDNTGYIIHPDEVLADNFSFLMIQQKSPSYTAKFSAAGKKLLVDMEQILKEK